MGRDIIVSAVRNLGERVIRKSKGSLKEGIIWRAELYARTGPTQEQKLKTSPTLIFFCHTFRNRYHCVFTKFLM